MTKAELYQKACMLPLLPGVYIIRDKSDTIIYIGTPSRKYWLTRMRRRLALPI